LCHIHVRFRMDLAYILRTPVLVLAGYYVDLRSLHREEKDLTLLFLLYSALYYRDVKNFNLNDHLDRGGVIFFNFQPPKIPFYPLHPYIILSLPTFAMESWDSLPISQSFRQQCHQLLSIFFRELQCSSPWFISIAKPVNGVQGTCLTSLLGLDYEDGVHFLCSIGLLRQGHSRSPNAITIVMAAWDKFIEEELLGDVMETIIKTAVSHTVYYFINYGKKSLLKHHPIDQFNGTISKPSRQISNVHNRQHRFHKKLS
jgi:hypothetical protein